MNDDRIIPMFNNDEDLLSWVRGQLWTLKNSKNLANDMVTFPCGRMAYTFQRMIDILTPMVGNTPGPVEYEPRGPNGVKREPIKVKAAKVPKEKKITLKANEKKVFAAIQKLIEDGTSPTYRGIATQMGVTSHAGIHAVVKRLGEYGIIEIIKQGKSSKISLV